MVVADEIARPLLAREGTEVHVQPHCPIWIHFCYSRQQLFKFRVVLSGAITVQREAHHLRTERYKLFKFMTVIRERTPEVCHDTLSACYDPPSACYGTLSLL